MCGIFGVIGFLKLRKIANDLLKYLKHRGPDDFSIISTPQYVLGMCRLRIRSEIHDQIPFFIFDNKYASYNGEIYSILNSQYDIIKKIEKGGSSEVENFLNAIKKKNIPNGMFVIAIFDKKENAMTFYRDPYGIKPLYYFNDIRNVIFSSEVKSLLLSVNKKFYFNQHAFDEAIFLGNYLCSETAIKGIKLLSKGSSLFLKNDRTKSFSISELNYLKKNFVNLKDVQNISSLRERLKNSINECLVGHRTLGLALSGGVDSSILAYELNSMGVKNLTTFSIKVHNQNDGIESLSELNLPEGVWRTWKHIVISFDINDLKHYTLEAIKHIGLPITLTSYPLYFKLAEAVHRAGVTILLTGEGADEIFGGYESYQKWFFSIDNTKSNIKRILNFYFPDQKVAIFKKLIGNKRLENLKKKFIDYYNPMISNSAINDLLLIERKLSLEPLLIRTDLALMRYSIEGRVPFLHGGLPEVLENMKGEEFISSTSTKLLLRKMYLDYKKIKEIKKKSFKASRDMLLSKEFKLWLHSIFKKNYKILNKLKFNQIYLKFLLNEEGFDEMKAGICFTVACAVLWYKFHFKT